MQYITQIYVHIQDAFNIHGVENSSEMCVSARRLLCNILHIYIYTHTRCIQYIRCAIHYMDTHTQEAFNIHGVLEASGVVSVWDALQ